MPVALPPWTDLDEVPLVEWARSVAPKKGDMVIFDLPSAAGHRRGVSQAGATLPLFGAKRGAGCGGRWLLVGPLAWVCSDMAALSSEDPRAPGYPSGSDGLPYSYYFTGREGTSAYANLEFADEAAPDKELEGGWSVAIRAQRSMNGSLWGETPHGLWVPMRDLGAAHPSTFHGELVNDGALDFAWVVSEHANGFAGPSVGKVSALHVRFERVAWRESREVPGGPMVRISDDDAATPEWMLARDLAHPDLSTPPDEVGGAATHERWVDVHLATQTLVAYDGTTPVFATLVSTGRGPQRSESATPLGVHRVWVKLAASTMDNAERDDVGKHYSMEDVPWVQFFDHAVALHGVYWHSQFGHVKSHGCVNLAPLDARWLFGWTSPRLPTGWAAAFPTEIEKGSAVRVR